MPSITGLLQLPPDHPTFAQLWANSELKFANACDAYEAYEAWQQDLDFDFPPSLLFALRIEHRTEVLSKVAQRAALQRRTGFVVPATDNLRRNGWFPIGQPSTFIGSSGAGKTKLVLQMLDAMRTGEKFLGDRHIPKQSVLWIQQDRGLEQLYDSLYDLFGSRKPWFPCVPPMAETGGEAFKRIGTLLAEHDYPEICIVDGLDILLPDTRGHAIKQVFPRLQRVAEGTKCAILGTWGSPKRQATKDAYTEIRLAASGGSEIGRLSATAALVTRDPDHDTARLFKVATRRSDDDRYHLMFSDDKPGWLGPVDPIALAKVRSAGSTDPIAFLKAAGFDWADVEGKVKVSRAGWYRKG